ncbi:MAG: family 78 glycoside hydrolase catalytic domain, partial [Armatimonadetes bacterium]|nr:family 78 glycoside hydrolase catalytic domain [Armatimonadota bacterium]
PFLLWVDASFSFDDGTTMRLTTDNGWKWDDGPLTFSHIYGGEDWDARLVQDGWDEPGFDDGDWKDVLVVDAPAGKLSKLPFPGLKEFERFHPVRIARPERNVTTYVFAQNCSALLEFVIEGERGDTVRFLPCEYLDSETDRVKFTYTWGTGKDIWHDYTLRGGGDEKHKIVFCYEGCQYVEVVGAVPEGDPNPDGLPVIKSLELVHVRADNPLVGQFQCSSEMQNGAFRLIDWSIRSNMSHVPTDCPHREKNGWQEENWHMARAISYRFDIRDWYRKVAQDLRDTQLEDGHVPTNVPNYLVGLPPHGFWNEAPEWGVASVLVPWHLYEWYGDKETLAESFESMKRFVDYLSSTAEDGVIDSNLGDWYDYGHGLGDGPSRWTPTKVSATAIWALGAKTVAIAAGVLGKRRDEAKYFELFDQIRASFIETFYDAETKTVKNNGSPQAGNCTALVVGLIPEEDREGALDAVIADLEERGWQQTTGEVLQVFLVRALGGAGRNDILHKVYAREERGGYGFMVNQGLTTLPESWDAKPGTGNSMNHFMLGHLMEWHFAYVAGIRQAAGSVGWKRVVIQPNPGPLESAEATFDSPAGEIAVEWSREGGKFEMEVRIPLGVTAEIVMPDGTRSTQGPGTRRYECDLP